MSKRPWFPFYTADFERKTKHLSAECVGCYIRLLRHYWDNNGHLEFDPNSLCRIMGIDRRRFNQTWRYLSPFLVIAKGKDGDTLLQERLQEELEKTIRISKIKAEAGKKGGEAYAQAQDKHMPTHSHSHINNHNKGTRLPADWQPSEKLIQWAEKERPTLNITTSTESFRDYWHSVSGAKGVKLKWDLVFRNWIRKDYGTSRQKGNSKSTRTVQTPADRHAEAVRRRQDSNAPLG